jgi:hypothetical protein
MVNILIGVLITVCFFLCLYTAYYLGRRQRKLDTAEKLSEQEELEVEKRMKGMQNVMEYDYDVAIGKKVNHGR